MKSIKLSKREFERALKLGLGRAYLHVRDYGDKGVERVIERSILTDFVYDNQFEGNRGWWTFSTLLNTGRIRDYAEFFMKNIGRGELRSVDYNHQLVLAGYFFEQGYTEFRPRVFELARKLLALREHECQCLQELISAAGEAGLQFGLVEFCKAEADLIKMTWECNEIYEYADNHMFSADKALDRIEEKHPDTRRFREAVKEFQIEESTPCVEKQPPTLEEILEFLDSCNSFARNYRVARFGRIAGDEHLAVIYNRLLKADTEILQHACMVAFCDRKLPVIENRVLKMLSAKNEKLRRACANALSNCEHPAVRRKALQLLKSDDAETLIFGLKLLENNYHSADASLILETLMKLRNSHDIHSAGIVLKHLSRGEGRNELKDCFLWLYENGPEAWCRAEFVKILYEWGACSDEILHESEWDSGDEVQEFARNVLTSRELEKNGRDSLCPNAE